MRTSKLLKLHSRCVDILDMIVKCENRLRHMNIDLLDAKRIGHLNIWYPDNVRNLEKNIAKFTGIKNRLTRYYLDVLNRINDTPVRIELTESESNLLTQQHLS